MDGICCTCQSIQPIVDSFDAADSRFGEEGNYVIAQHDNQAGQPCDGAGDHPQALVRYKGEY